MIYATISMYYASRKAAASAAGFINECGYLSASLTGILTGYLVDNSGWNYGFYFWICGALMATVLMLFL